MMSKKDIGGWLRRRGNRIHNWSRKWFVLHDKTLMMYSKEGDVKCLETIYLDKQMIVEPSTDPHDPKQGFFDIVCGNETISLCADTIEEKQTWLKALKRTLYAKKGGALFNQSLDEILFWEKTSGRRIPYIVDECIQYLYKYGLEVEGIFRLGGRLAAIKEVIARFDRGEKIEFEKEDTDIHVVASVLKAFLRDLPDSLIPCQYYQKFMNLALRFMDAKDEDAKDNHVRDLTKAMDLIPDDNYIILKYICNFLKKVSLHSDKNKMTMMNLGTIFGNNIIRHIDKENSQLLLCTADLGQNLIFMLLNYLSQVFVRELKEEEIEDNSVETADLLHMSDTTVAPLTSAPSEKDICDDLKGLDLSSNPPNRSMQFVEDNNSESRSGNEFGNGKEVKRKRALHLSLERNPHVETTDSSVPSSPFNGLSPNPIPPLSKKLMRKRPVSERSRPIGVHLPQGSRDSSSSPISPKRDFYTPPETPSSVEDSFPKFQSADCLPLPGKSTLQQDEGDNDDDADTLSFSKGIAADESNGPKGGEYLPTYEELLAENKKLKKDIAVQKERYGKDVSALRSQHMDLNQKYQQRIKTMETCFENQKKNLEIKLEQEKINIVAAVEGTIKLKKELMKYQMKYGELTS